MANEEIFPRSWKIDKLRNSIEEGNIKIPPFQRGFVWDKEKIRSFLDSIYQNYPIGSILFWSSKENIKSPRNVGYFLLPKHEPDFPVNYVLDGQQRLTTLYGVFCRDRKIDPESKININSGLFDVYFDLVTEEFLFKDEINDSHSNLKMSTLFDAGKFHKEVNKIEKKYRKKAESIQYQFSNYEVPIIITNKQEKEQVGRIFERINNTGAKLTLLDLMVAWTWNDDFHLQKEIKDIQDSLASKGFDDIDDKIFLQCISAIIMKSTKTKDILSLKPDAVRKAIEKLRTSLEKAIDFLSTEFKISSIDFLPHSHQVVPLAFFFSRVKVPTETQSSILKKWFWRTAFSKRYAGSTDQKMNDDIEFFEKVVKNEPKAVIKKGFSKYEYTFDENDLIKQRFSKSNPFARAFLLLLAQNKPRCLVNGNLIDTGAALSSYNQKEFHHVFPRKFLKDQQYEIEKINSICNYCLLPSGPNKMILKRAPSDYMFNLIPRNKYTDIMKSNLLPTKKDVYKDDDYETFLSKRATKILNFFTELISD